MLSDASETNGRFIDYSYYPCSQQEDDILGTGVTCETDKIKVQEHFDLHYPNEDNLVLEQNAISFSWMESFISSDSSKLLATPVSKEKGYDAYHMVPIYKSISQFIANTEE